MDLCCLCPPAGWDEIIRLKEQLEGLSCFRSQRYQLLALHSMVPTQDQRKVFLRPPAGVRKIILATNIAETAVTIDDIVCVINSGRPSRFVLLIRACIGAAEGCNQECWCLLVLACWFIKAWCCLLQHCCILSMFGM